MVTPFHILPQAVLQLEAPVILFDTNQRQKVKVSVKNLGPSLSGTLKMETPKSWELNPKSIQVAIAGKGDQSDFYFDIKSPSEATIGYLKPILQSPTTKLQASLREVAYNHIPKQYLISPAQSKVVTLNLKTGVEKEPI